MLAKIADLRQMADATGRPIRITADGGVTRETAPRMLAAGCDTLVAGTSVFGAPTTPPRSPPAAGRLDGGCGGCATPAVRMAKLPSLRMGRIPDGPTLPVRDLWPGDPARGARLLKGELEVGGAVLRLRPGNGATPARPR